MQNLTHPNNELVFLPDLLSLLRQAPNHHIQFHTQDRIKCEYKILFWQTLQNDLLISALLLPLLRSNSETGHNSQLS